MEDEIIEEKLFCVERARQGRAACRICKEKCLTGELRIAKIVPSPFGSGKMKSWHHLDCIFEQFLKQRVNTKRIEQHNDLDGWDDLNDDDKDTLIKKIAGSEIAFAEKHKLKIPENYLKVKLSEKHAASSVDVPQNLDVKTSIKPTFTTCGKLKFSSESSISVSSKTEEQVSVSLETKKQISTSSENSQEPENLHEDLLFRTFRQLVTNIAQVTSYTEKTNLVNAVFTKDSDGSGFKGNITQWCRLLLTDEDKRTYNLQSKQLIKLFSKIFVTEQTTMISYLNKHEIGETIQHFFKKSKIFKPANISLLTIQAVDDFLNELSQLTKEEEQINHFKVFAARCTSKDLKIVIRLIKHDLRMNAGTKCILQGVHPDAYTLYRASKNLDEVINKSLSEKVGKGNLAGLKASINVLTPIQPMLAEACKSITSAMKKFPNGMYAEIKYDGERVQLHKYGSDFKYYSRSLKPVLPHKISHLKNYIPIAFPRGEDLILDSEILLIDTITGKPLPFGTLGVHKKSEFKNANVCLFVFDCMYYNGESLIQQPIKYRKKILRENMIEIPNRILFSEMTVITCPKELSNMTAKVLEMGLEGLVLKDLKSKYEPGKRHWLKVKKDYLFDGAMADTADLIVLGAWYGTGRKAGMMSVFLMGCYNEYSEKYCTVTKVHTGHDDKTLERLQTELKMIEISSDPAKVPNWLKCTKTMIPDFVAEDPKNQPIWEITGAEFTQHNVHTADGISIRFPRVTKIRNDKNWETATTLTELKNLYTKSKENTDVKLIMELHKENDQVSDDGASPSKRLRIDVGQDTEEGETAACKIIDPLPNIFAQIRLLVDNGAQQQFEKWIRYFVAYGGTVLKSEMWKEATHVLHLEDSVNTRNISSSINARHIIIEWIKDCVLNQTLQDIQSYTVRWEPVGNQLIV